MALALALAGGPSGSCVVHRPHHARATRTASQGQRHNRGTLLLDILCMYFSLMSLIRYSRRLETILGLDRCFCISNGLRVCLVLFPSRMDGRGLDRFESWFTPFTPYFILIEPFGSTSAYMLASSAISSMSGGAASLAILPSQLPNRHNNCTY